MTLALALSTQAFATSIQVDSACVTKQKNAASFQLAQEEAQPVNYAKVVAFNYGMWTEMPGENSGSDDITVTLETPAGTRIQKYTVSAQQIGNSGNCSITGIEAKSL
jgi:hypothetical protein